MTILRNSFIILLSAALLTACAERQPQEEKTPLVVSLLSVNVAALGEQKTITLSSSSDWYARSGKAWLKAVTVSGKGSAEPQQMTIAVEENKTTSERTAELTISNLDGESAKVIVNQQAGNGDTGRRGIYTAEDLVGFSKATHGEGSIALYLVDGVVKLMNDIDASSIKEWIPAGSQSNPLTYRFDGDGHTIKNVNWSVDLSKYPYAGLIGYAKGITIENLSFGSEGSRVEFKGTSAQAAQIGGIVGTAISTKIEKVTNNATLVMKENGGPGKNISIGGIAGYTDALSKLGNDMQNFGCVNNGNILVSVPCKEGGLVGHNDGVISKCTNNGAILGKISGILGPGWGCSYNKVRENFTGNTGAGHVGDYDKYASNPSAAPSDAILNSMMNASAGYEIEDNHIDWTAESYYDWDVVESIPLHSGATYTHYSFSLVPRHMHVLEIDLSDPGIELSSAVADDVFPNPNGNGNNNNGYNIRETLSQLCTRKRNQGQAILAGTNCCFFDSNNGISRGFHVEDCEPVYINNPSVVNRLVNHSWCFAVYTDGTAACGKKAFTGKLRTGGTEHPFYSVNDTTLRHSSPSVSPVNLFTSRYVRVPHAAHPKLVNDLARDVLYIICEYSSEPMKVNAGYASAKVVSMIDGRKSLISELPYISQKNRVGIAASGSAASKLESVKVGDTVELRCDITVEGHASTPILALESTMFQIMDKGKDGTSTIPVTNQSITNYDPLTFPVVSEDGKKVWLVEIDGRQLWYSMGVKAYEMYRIARKLGGWSVTRMDGGGSSAMWVWNPTTSRGGLVNRPSDSKGERSCLTYMILREKH
ncbi:MAG: phosphodiester glycosidase family protein [Bacteroidales bacterium]|nr:phosphodiester glycosidase family protein [Bacteroidales bacterium]